MTGKEKNILIIKGNIIFTKESETFTTLKKFIYCSK